jgi:hypothetical protein
LPITLKTLDANHIARFHAELALADARPLYFCDTDGTRAGVLWYIHKVTVDHVDPLVARRDAEEIGLKDDAFWKVATAYLDALRPAPTPVATSPTTRAQDAASTAPAPPTAGPPPEASKSSGHPTSYVSTGWKPLAALVVTGVAAPRAYFTGASIPSYFRGLARASLPGPRPTPKSLPGGSDV